MDEQELTPETEAEQELPERYEPAPSKLWGPPFSPNLLRRNPPRPRRVGPGPESARAARPAPAKLRVAAHRPRPRPGLQRG